MGKIHLKKWTEPKHRGQAPVSHVTSPQCGCSQLICESAHKGQAERKHQPQFLKLYLSSNFVSAMMQASLGSGWGVKWNVCSGP